MRTDDEIGTRGFLADIWQYAKAWYFPRMDIVLHGDGYVTSWGPGDVPWVVFIRGATEEEIRIVALAVRARVEESRLLSSRF